MKIRLYNGQKIVINTGDSTDSVFSHISANRTDNTHTFLRMSANRFHNVFIIEKEGNIEIFIFQKEDEIQRKDFGWHEDGNIIFTNYVGEI